MKLFSLKRKKQDPDFAFQIDDVFALKVDGVVVTGKVTSGILRCGDQVLCIPKDGNSFSCVIEGIEQPNPMRQGQYVHPSEARANGPCNGHYALRILGRDKSDFHPGDQLFPITYTPPQNNF